MLAKYIDTSQPIHSKKITTPFRTAIPRNSQKRAQRFSGGNPCRPPNGSHRDSWPARKASPQGPVSAALLAERPKSINCTSGVWPIWRSGGEGWNQKTHRTCSMGLWKILGKKITGDMFIKKRGEEWEKHAETHGEASWCFGEPKVDLKNSHFTNICNGKLSKLFPNTKTKCIKMHYLQMVGSFILPC